MGYWRKMSELKLINEDGRVVAKPYLWLMNFILKPNFILEKIVTNYQILVTYFPKPITHYRLPVT